MKLRLIRRLCFILMCTVFALYIIMQYYGEPREKNLLTLQFAIKDLHEKSRVSLSMPWLADISVRQKWHDISRLDSPDVVIQSTTKLKSMIDSNQSRRLTIETFQGPVCQQSYYDNTNTTYQMNDIYNHLAFDDQPGGWIKTFEKYFTTETKPNLDATLTTLNKRKEAKFVYSEVSFLNLWVDTLSQDQKEIFKSLLRSGRWEIVSGGWVMPDEAVTHYYSIIDQFIEDYRPNITWSIDPFGQSSTMPYLLKKLGFSQMIINRVHYEVKKYLAHRKSLEFIWHQPWDSTGSHSMFAHMFPFFSYDVPHTCGPEPSVCCQFDFIRINKFGCPWHKPPVLIDDSNIAVRADMLADQYRKKATLYNNNGLVLIPLGDDFRYQTTHEWNIQLDNYNKLIEYINSKASYRMKIRFSTLSNYFQVLNERINKMNSTLFASFPSLSGDFLTYADRQHDYWSGYYNSNPYEKSLSRLLESELRSAEILYSYARQSVGRLQNVAQLIPLITDLYKNLTIVRRNLGLFQHHDAITGTSRPEVMLDYSENAYLLLLNSALKSDVVISNKRLPVSNKLKQLLIQLKDEYQTGNNNDVTTSNTISGNTLHSFYSLEDNLHNYQHSEPILIHFSENNNNADIVNTRRIYIFNPSTRNRSTIITLQVKGHLQHFEAKQITSSPTESMDHLNIQLEHSWTNALNSKHHQQQPVSLLNLGPVKLYPLSFSCIELKLTSKSSASSVIQVKPQLIQVANDENIIVQKYQKMLNKLTGKSMNMKINFIQYQSLQGESHSGRYLFIPDGLGQPLHNPNSYKYTKGNLVDTVTVYTEYVTHTVRLYKSDDLHSQFIEIENIVNIVVNSPTDIDLFMTIQTDLINKDRAQYHDKIPLQGNVYPIACGAYLEQEMDSFLNNDNSQTKQFQRLNLFTSYPTGVVSPEIGQINVWIDRRSSRDDLRGAQSNLNGEWILQSRLRLFTEIISIDNTQEKKSVPGLTVFSQQILSDLLRPVHKFYVNQPTLNDLLVTDYHLMPTSGLPCDYELVTMKTFHNSKIPKVCYAKTLPNIDFYSKCVNDIGQNDELNVQELFGSIQLSHAIQTNLTLIPYSTDRKTKHIHIRPMELEAFYLV
ncbi:Alpha-mannosidase 2 [Schistosoma japonicum]|nr:Alpha-mannosidase 2 [Schistosoma japonicum]